MPKLWNDTIEAHRQSVRDATLDATAALVMQHGLTSVTMSQIAKDTGIGRATLYKYFPDVDAIMVAWHERMIGQHMAQLHAVAHREGADPLTTLRAVLETYGHSMQAQHGHALAAHLHRLPHARSAEQHLRSFVKKLIEDAAKAGLVRSDVASDELAAYVLGALSATEGSSSKPAIKRLVDVTLTGLIKPKQ